MHDSRMDRSFDLPDFDISVTVIVQDGIVEHEMASLRLANSFQFVWSHIPLGDKTAIANHWKSNGFRVEISRTMWERPSPAMATTEPQGFAIQFRWNTCQLFPDDCLQALVAHEMGHVYQFATGKNRFTLKEEDLLGFLDLLPLKLTDDGLVELHADEMAVRWGFDPVTFCAFLLRYYNYDQRTGEYVSRKPPRNEKRAYNQAKKERRDYRYHPRIICLRNNGR
jgi:hypothetical protein